MNPTQQLHDAGQSLWLDNITRKMLDDGTIKGYIDELAVTGLTSNPSIFDAAIGGGAYDDAISEKVSAGKSGEDLFFELATEDLQRAADLFRPAFDASATVDGYVSLEVSPLIAYDTEATIEMAKSLHEGAARDNLFIKIPGTPEGLPAIEESIFAGIPINVTLLFDRAQYEAAADAYLKGIERRIEAGRSPDVRSVASVFISRWDKAVIDTVPDDLRDKLGVAVGVQSYVGYRELLDSDRYKKLASEGAREQRLLFASTSTKDPNAPDTLYVEGLAAPDTINTMPDSTLEAFADHGKVGAMLPDDGGDSAGVLKQFNEAGIDTKKLAEQLQSEGADAFVKSWKELLNRIEDKSKELA